MIRTYALDTTRHIGTIKVSNGHSTEEHYLNQLILLQLAPCSPVWFYIIYHNVKFVFLIYYAPSV